MPAIDTPPAPVHYESSAFDLSAVDAARDTSERDLDLGAVATPPCAPTAQDGLPQAIVVCGSRRTRDYRVPPIKGAFDVAEAPFRAELGLGDNASVGVHGETVMINNAKTNRMMVTYTLKF